MPCYAPIFRRVWRGASTLSRQTPTPAFSSSNGTGPDSKASWNRIDNAMSHDEEVQLTTYATGPASTRIKGSDKSDMKGINDKSDIAWESHAL